MKKIPLILFALCALIIVGLPISGSPIIIANAMSGSRNLIQFSSRVAVVEPVFSATAYSNAFYVFYSSYGSSSDAFIQKDLNLLNVTVKFGWGWSSQLIRFLTSGRAKEHGLVVGQTLNVIDEINVTEGGLFRNGNRVYDYVVLGFTEYVTQGEYDAYKEFVATGGTLVIMDACNFLAEVKYYPPSSPGQPSYLSLVKGHGWEFNGTHAWKSVYHRWWDENKNWVGSNYWKYWWGNHYDSFVANTTHPISQYLRGAYGTSISTPYTAHEENLLQNLTETEIVGYWNLIDPGEYPGQPIAAYQHRYVNGTVFHSGIMASDIIGNDVCMQLFLLGAVGALYTTSGIESGLTLPGEAIVVGAAIGLVVIMVLLFHICDMRERKRSRDNVLTRRRR